MPGAGTGLVVFIGSWESLQYCRIHNKVCKPLLLLPRIQVCIELIKHLVITDKHLSIHISRESHFYYKMFFISQIVNGRAMIIKLPFHFLPVDKP